MTGYDKILKQRFYLVVMTGIFILLFLQASCASRPEGTEDSPILEEDTTGALLLADFHERQGLECAECHKEDPPKQGVSTGICLNCHEDYKWSEPEDYHNRDPHSSHFEYTDCGECHHAHKPSKALCVECHVNFDFQIR